MPLPLPVRWVMGLVAVAVGAILLYGLLQAADTLYVIARIIHFTYDYLLSSSSQQE